MALRRRLTVGLVVTLVVLGASALGTRPAGAQAALPYLAYGVGLERGQIVEALVDGTPVGRAVADARGRWKMLIEPGPVANGDTMTFSVDGVATGKAVVFLSGRFPAPPGIALAAGSTAAADVAAPTSRATAMPRPTATPRRTASPRPAATPKPKAACTKDGRAVACSPFVLPMPRP